MIRNFLQSTFFLTAVLFCALAYNAQSTADTQSRGDNTLVDIRLGLTPRRTRIVFDLIAPPSFRTVAQDDPHLLVIEIEGAANSIDLTQLNLRGSAVKEMAATQSSPGITRFTLRLRDTIQPDLFPQKPHGGRSHRLVLDLTQQTAVADNKQISASETKKVREPLPTPTASPEDAQAAAPDSEQTGVRETQLDSAKSTPALAVATVTTPPTTANLDPFEPGEPREPETYIEWSGYVGMEARVFRQSPAHPDQDKQHGSIAFAPELYIERDYGKQLIAFSPFLRYDFRDSERSHIDLREFYWQWEQDQWLIKAGVDVVFWGVAESQQLIDVINQRDIVENIDEEDRLGQPMLNVDYMTDSFGTLQAYLLPWFRERTYPGRHGRLRTEPVVDTNEAIYDASNEEKHLDLALRWSHYIGDWDLGVAHFSGTSRTPVLIPAAGGENALNPLYLQIEQTSLDAQATKGAWLWKLEALYNSNKIEDYFATVGGFEFTWYGINDSAADIGWLLEYHYDERDERSQSAFQNDLFAGLRYSGNDMGSTQVLLGTIYDLDNDSVFGNIEASRRLGESWLLSIEARFFTQIDRQDPLWQLRRDDYMELLLQRYF